MSRADSQIEINLGKACNNRCIFCSNGAVPADERRFISQEVVVAELERAAERETPGVGFLGGEPTIYPGIEEIVHHAKQLGFRRIALCTNGRRLADAPFLAELVGAGVNRITLSIHSQRAAVEDELCGRKNAFAQKVTAIRNIVAGQRTGRLDLSHGFALNTCIHGLNHRELVSFAAFQKKLGVTDLRLNFLRPEHRAVGDERLVPRLSEVVAGLTPLFVWNESQGRLRLTVSDIPLCLFPKPLRETPGLLSRYLGENWDMETSVVVFRQAGRLRDDFSWKDRRTNRLKSMGERCGACAARDRCEGVWTRYLEIYGSDELRPLPASERMGR